MTTDQPTPSPPSEGIALEAQPAYARAPRRPRGLPLWANGLIVAAFVGLLVFLHFRVVQVCYVPSGSMIPTFEVGDRVLAYLGAYWHHPPQPGDVVLFHAPRHRGFEVKRVIGAGGDTIVVAWGKVYRNGELAEEPYIAEPMVFERPRMVRLRPDQLWVMGDNRNHSEDSRDWGPLNEKQVVGRLFYRLLPLGRRGPVR